jgi:glycosyltransferase involved in cell wall biosynthesis
MGGAQYQAKCIIDYISDYKYEIYYLTSRADFKHTPSSHKLIDISSSKLNKYGTFFDSNRLYSALKKIKPDIIYQRVGCAYTGVIAFYAKKNNIKSIWHIAHESDVAKDKFLLKGKLFFIEKLIFEYGIRNIKSIIAQTDYQASALERNYGRKANAVLPNFHPAPENEIIKENPLKVVWVANLKTHKQPEIFLRLCDDLRGRYEDVKFIMIGSNQFGTKRWREYIQTVIRQCENVIYLGALPIEEVNKVLAEAHLLVNTSIAEGFSNTFIQAWMRKVPVMTLNVDPDDVLRREKIGIKAGNYENLLATVKKMIEDSGLRERMAERAKDYAFSHHSYENIEKLFEFLR